jgi:hypothetical protein
VPDAHPAFSGATADAYEGPNPWPPQTEGARSWPKAVALRKRLIAEIEGE